MSAAERRFSEREGFVQRLVQWDSMDAALRNSIWNVIASALPKYELSDFYWNAVESIVANVLRLPTERIERDLGRSWLLHQVERLEWYEVYDLLEYVVTHAQTLSPRFPNAPASLPSAANKVLEREQSGWRYLGGRLTRIIDPVETAEVGAALAAAKRTGLDGVHGHISQAVILLGKRPDADYSNAVKEAISAVEAAAKLIAGVNEGGLDRALEVLSGRMEIHGALKAALKNLYGYASDEGGVRHANLAAASNVTGEDARFVIVTCSAAVNWIIAKADKAGLLQKA
jgi:hypothetical protein